MFCSNCGKPLDNGSVFCPECGTRVNGDDNNFMEKPAFPDEESEKNVCIPETENENSNINDQYIQDDEQEASTAEISDDEELSETPPPVEANPDSTFAENGKAVAPEESLNTAPEQKNPETISQPELIKNGDKYDTMTIPSGLSEHDQSFSRNNDQQQNNIPGLHPVFNTQPAFDNGIPVQPQTPPPFIPSETVPVQKSSKVGAGRIIGASAVSVFAVVFLIILSFALCFKFGASGKVIKNRIENLSANTLLSAEFEDDEISDNIYKTIGFRSITHGNATEADFKDFLVKSNMLSFIGENAENYAEYIFNGKGKDPSIGASEIKTDFFKANNDVADEVFGYTLAKDDLKLIQSRLEEENIDDALSVKEWNKKAGFDLKNVSYILSYITLGVFLALIIVLFIWIAIIVDKKCRHIMGFYGNILFISGIILFVSGLGVLAGSAIAYSITGNVMFYLIQNVLLMFGILASAAGAFELILGIIFKKIGKSKKKKEKTIDLIKQEAVPAYN